MRGGREQRAALDISEGHRPKWQREKVLRGRQEMGRGRRIGLGSKRTNSGLDGMRRLRSRAWKWSRDRTGRRKFGVFRKEA